MTSRTLQDVFPVMKDMVSLELALAALYQACGERFPEDSDFWSAIQRQEELHAQLIQNLADLIAAHPDEFRCGRPFNSTAVKTMLASVTGYTDQVRKGQFPRQRVLFLAKDLENSLLEASYRDIVSSDNVEFRKTIERIGSETQAHKNLFAAEAARSRA